MSEGKKEILLGDCLELMKNIPNGSIDMILCDLPYGTTSIGWDCVLDMFELWNEYNRIIKTNGAIVLFAAQPFTSKLILSNIKNYKYSWVWDKKSATGGQFARKQPMRRTEDICVFYKKQCTYNPQLEDKEKKYIRYIKKDYENNSKHISNTKSFSTNANTRTIPEDKKYPSNIISISSGSHKNKIHETQKPVPLFEYLIKTYTNENDLVLDNTAGSGTTAIACLNTNRQFIVMEKEQKYYDTILKRVADFNKKFETQTLFENEM